MTNHLFDTPEKLFDAVRSTTLSDDERARLRAHADAYASAHPAIVSPYFSWLRRPLPILAAVLIVAVLGGGTAYAAEGALPGDALYSVKVHVNEPIAEALAVTPKEQATVNANIATERLNEAQQLAAKGRLSTTTAVHLEANYEAHVAQADAAVATVAQHDPSLAAQLHASLESRVAARGQVLKLLQADAPRGEKGDRGEGHGRAESRSTLVGTTTASSTQVVPLQSSIRIHGEDEAPEDGGTSGLMQASSTLRVNLPGAAEDGLEHAERGSSRGNVRGELDF